MIVLFDGINYKLIAPKGEGVLDKTIQSNCEHIFGSGSVAMRWSQNNCKTCNSLT